MLREQHMSVEQQVRDYILENYLFTDDQSALNNADSFLETGILDSTGILEVIYFIEEDFDIKVEDDEMIPENLDSVDHIVAFVSGKQTA
jgi:acyl carrier protein